MSHIFIALLLIAGDGGAASGAQSPAEAAVAWLSALARHDAATLRRLSAFPLVVDGFQSNDRGDTNACNEVPGMVRNRKTQEVLVVAASEAQFDKMIACVLSDNATGEWTEQPDGRGRFRGRVRLLSKAEDSSRRLARYRKEVSRLPKPRVLVEAVTKNDGVTLSALIVMREAGQGQLAVEAVHTDFLFEE